MPAGVWVQELLGSERNHFDRFGHFMQGFVPAIIFREVFLRCSPLKRGGWLVYVVLTSCLAFSACFELIEWRATILSGDDADAFLGHQGDIWDAQWDMLWAIRRCNHSLGPLVSAPRPFSQPVAWPTAVGGFTFICDALQLTSLLSPTDSIE